MSKKLPSNCPQELVEILEEVELPRFNRPHKETDILPKGAIYDPGPDEMFVPDPPPTPTP